MTKIHKVIFPFGSIIGFMSLDDLLSINFLSVDAALSHLYISGIHEKPRSLQALPFLFSTRMSSRFSSFTLKKRPEPATQAMIEDTERTGNESCSLSSISVRDGLMWWVGVRRTIEGGGDKLIFVTSWMTIFGVRESWWTEKLFCESWLKCSLWNLNYQNFR